MSRKVLFIVLIVALTSVFAVSCKQDMANGSSLYGTWYGKLSYSVVTEEYTFTVNDATDFTLVEKATMFGSSTTETIHGTYKFTSDTEGTLTAKVDVDVIKTDGSTETTRTIPFTLAGDKLTITDPDEGLSVVLTRQADK